MIISLTGYMGSGKTTVGRIVADALGCVFLDLDQLVEAREKRSIAEIFRTDGEAAFRKAEEEVLAVTLKKYAQGNIVLALGGGAVLSARSRKLLQEQTTCIWLQAPAETLLARISKSPTRPLADEHFAARLAERLPLYEAAAHVTIDTTGLSPEEVADEIIITCL